LALDTHGDVYIADAGNSRIVVLSPAGKTLTAWSTNPHHYGCNDTPDNLWVDGDKHVYVDAGGFCQAYNGSSYSHSRVLKFSARGKLLHTWSQDDLDIAMANAHGLFLCNGHLQGPHVRHLPPALCGRANLTMDSKGNIYSPPGRPDAAVVKFSPAGRVLRRYGAFQFNNPLGLAVNQQGDIYVTDDNSAIDANGGHDATKGSVVKLSPLGRTLAVWKAFRSPVALALDRRQNVYVLDAGDNELLKLSPKGRTLRVWKHS
jgi:DNA-binding beta-propeller fold protein YncE